MDRHPVSEQLGRPDNDGEAQSDPFRSGGAAELKVALEDPLGLVRRDSAPCVADRDLNVPLRLGTDERDRPFVVYLMAFPMRLRRICSSNSGSLRTTKGEGLTSKSRPDISAKG